MRGRAALFLCAIVAGATAVYAHAFAPSLLALSETAGGATDVTWKTPRLVVMGADVRPELPSTCRALGKPTIEDTETAVTRRWRVDCGAGGLIGKRVGIAGLATANTNALIRLALADGRLLQHVVTIESPSYIIPALPQPRDIASTYLWAGMMQLLGRFDCVLFVLGLMLLAPPALPLVRTLAAFTIGHSIMLAGAMFGALALPARPIELVVAATVVALATELAREPSRTFVRRFPWMMGFFFGVLHGVAFATALRELGLPTSHAALAVFSFNVGIELAQLTFVGFVLLSAYVLRAVAGTYPVWARQVSVYVMGSLGAFWCFERASALLR